MTLDMAEPGQEYILRSIYGGCRLRRMLQERGFTEGVSIKVIKGGPIGPFIVEFRSSRVILDRMIRFMNAGVPESAAATESDGDGGVYCLF